MLPVARFACFVLGCADMEILRLTTLSRRLRSLGGLVVMISFLIYSICSCIAISVLLPKYTFCCSCDHVSYSFLIAEHLSCSAYGPTSHSRRHTD